jgi:ADP-heptose:LPS heptosyltransferase
VQVLYKFTPDCDLNRLISQLVQSLSRLYKENREASLAESSNLVKQYMNKLVSQIAGKEDDEEFDMVIVTSQLVKSSFILWLFVTQKEIDHRLKVFLKKFIGEFLLEQIAQDIYLYLANFVINSKNGTLTPIQ